MFATDGYVIRAHGQLAIALASEGLIDDLALLLDTCGVPSRKYAKPNAHAGAWELLIGASHVKRLAGKINILHKQKDFTDALSYQHRPSTIFGYPYEVLKGLQWRSRFCTPAIKTKSAGELVSDDKFQRLCDELDPSLKKWKRSDFIYDRVREINDTQEKDVYHLEIDSDNYDHKNYIANGYVVHNTELVIVLFTAWCYVKNPRCEFIHLSYSDPLVLENSDSIKDIIKSAPFRELWPDLTIRVSKDSKKAWETTAGGKFYATASGGQVTGFGAGRLDEVQPDGSFKFSGCLLIDDPIKPDDARSDVVRRSINDRWDSTVKSRRNSPTTPVVCIMQRVHEDDYTGMLRKDTEFDWFVREMPALIDETTALWPAKHTVEQLKAMRAKNPYMFAAQMQQRPSPLGGGLFKGDWFKRYDALPQLSYRKIYADTAQKTGERHDYSVFEVWGMRADGAGICLVDMIRGKWEAPELKRQALSFWKKHAALPIDHLGSLRQMRVEDKASGTGLIQDIRTTGGIPIHAQQRNRDKFMRAGDAAPYVESGMLWVPADAPFTSEFIGECEAFTSDDTHAHDDQIDPMMDAIDDMLAGLGGLKVWENML